MRLIDADALKEELNSWAVDLTKSKALHYIKDDADCIIDNAPTIDPFKDKSLEQLMDDAFTRGYYKGREVFNPVKHGRWLSTDTNTCECSVCHTCEPYPFSEFEWCPNCGARMDGGEENDDK